MSPAAVIFKVSNTKTLYGETDFALLKNICNQYLNFMLRVTDRFCCFFFELLIGPYPTFLECIICNRIGQLCRSGPGYSSNTVRRAVYAVNIC